MEPMEVNVISPLKVFENLDRDKDQFKSECSKYAERVTTDEYTILQIIEDLGPFLIHESPRKRLEGMWILSDIIELLPISFLDSIQLEFLSVFYADRLKDHSQVIPPVLQGILTITHQKELPDGACTRLLSSLFHNVACQQQQMQDRSNIYKIFEVMVKRKLNELRMMNYDFICGVMSAIDSERDPLNLVFLFNWFPTFLQEFNFGHLTEEMFDVISCYFPVDFKVPADMAKGVSRESLADSLAPCLCAIPEFAEFCLPLALEKLNSSLRIAKIDSLQLLYLGCEHFPEAKYLEYSTKIWTSIQLELFKINNEDRELEQTCLKTLQAFIYKISESNTDTFKTILRNITDTLRGNLVLEQNYFQSSVQLLLTVSRSSCNSAKHVSKEILPLFLNLFKITLDVEKKVLLLDILGSFTEIYLEKNNDNNEVPEINIIINLYLDMTKQLEINLRAKALECLSKFIKKMDSKTIEELGEIIHNYIFIEQESQVVMSIKLCLRELGKFNPKKLLEIVTFTNNLNDSKSLEFYLNYLVSIVDQPLLQVYVLDFVLEYCYSYNEMTILALFALKSILKVHDCNENIQTYVFNKGIINRVSNWSLNNSANEVFSDEFLKDISDVFKIIMGYQSSEKQQEIIERSQNIFINFKSRPSRFNLYIMDGLIMRLRQDVVKDFTIIDEIFKIALSALDENILDTSVQLLANLINKIPNDEGIFNNLYIKCCINSEQGNCDFNHIRNVSCITAWITKSLLMRGHHLSSIWITKLMDLVKNYSIASIYLKIIMRDDYNSLSDISYCNKRLFYQQRFFVQFSTIINENEDNYLVAFALILEDIPEKLLNMYFDKVINLIISILNKSEDPKVLLPVLSKLKYLIKNQDESATIYMEQYITKLLKLTRFRESLAIRLLAIECLDLYTNGYPVYKLLHFKDLVIKVLKESLDDHKRLVRKAAMEARLKWYLFDTPT